MAEGSGHIVTPDGRRVDISLSGPADGRPVLFHTGTPSAGRAYAPWTQAGAERGLRHVAYSRPGYGGSDRLAGRSVADSVSDVAAIADQLEIDRFFTIGWSGGGPHALACAALLPDRTLAAATLAGVAPRDAAELDWLHGMGAENVEEFAAAEAGDQQLGTYLEPHARALGGLSGEDIAAGLGDLVSDVDRDALTGEFAEYLAAAMREALSLGPWGWHDDDLAFVRDWGFELGSIEVPVTVWQGRHDRMVPFAHGEWLAANVRGARARLLDDHGHISMLGLYERVLDELIASAA